MLMKCFLKYSLSFLSGAVTTTIILIPAFYTYSRLKNPRWVNDSSKKHDFSAIIEELYQDHIRTGDLEYELYEEKLTFDKNKPGCVLVKSCEIEYLLFRKLL